MTTSRPREDKKVIPLLFGEIVPAKCKLSVAMPISKFRLEGSNLPGVENQGRTSDPYFNVYTVSGEGGKGVKIFHSDTIMETLHPEWKPASFPNKLSELRELPDRIIIEVKDWSALSSWLGVNKLLGETAVLTVSELKDGQQIPLVDESKRPIPGYLKIFFAENPDPKPVVITTSTDVVTATPSAEAVAATPDKSVDKYAVPETSLVLAVSAKIGCDAAQTMLNVMAVVANIAVPGLGLMLQSLTAISEAVDKYKETSTEAAELLVFCVSTANTLGTLRSLKPDQISDDLNQKLVDAGEALQKLHDTLIHIRSRTKFEMFFMQQQYALAASSAKQKTEDALDELMRSAQVENLKDCKEIKSSIQNLLKQSKHLMLGVEEQLRDMERNLAKQYKEETAQLKALLKELKANHEKQMEQMQQLIDLFKGSGTQKDIPQAVKAPVKRLIISTGDISDVDGFIAVAEYSKTGADLLFVMNYPGYIGTDIGEDEMEDYAEQNPGKGYKYNAKKVLEAVKDAPPKYTNFMNRYNSCSKPADVLKAALTDAAFHILCRVWKDLPVSDRGKCYFCVGGINDINPFSCIAIRNDILTYVDSFEDAIVSIDPTEGNVYDGDGKLFSLDLAAYDQIYFDFNGSVAFFSSEWQEKLFCEAVVKKIKGVFVMGGVYDDVMPMTLPAIPKILNRFSGATMNQLYHPMRSARFFKALAGNKDIPVFIISNNVVGEVTTYAPCDPKTELRDRKRTFDGVQAFLKSNELEGNYLTAISKLHYLGNKPPGSHKIFDYYTALTLTCFMQEVAVRAAGGDVDASLLMFPTRNLFFDYSVGLTFVSNRDWWHEVIDSYIMVMKAACENDGKREAFKKEIKYMKLTRPKENKGGILEVKSVQFGLDPGSMKVTLEVLQKDLVENPDRSLSASAVVPSSKSNFEV